MGLVQQDGLRVHINSISPYNNRIVEWMYYPENPSIIDPQEQQSDYYDRYVVVPSCPLQAANFNLATVRAHVMESFEPELNYFNNTKVKVPKNKLCNLVNHH